MGLIGLTMPGLKWGAREGRMLRLQRHCCRFWRAERRRESVLEELPAQWELQRASAEGR